MRQVASRKARVGGRPTYMHTHMPCTHTAISIQHNIYIYTHISSRRIIHEHESRCKPAATRPRPAHHMHAPPRPQPPPSSQRRMRIPSPSPRRSRTAECMAPTCTPRQGGATIAPPEALRTPRLAGGAVAQHKARHGTRKRQSRAAECSHVVHVSGV